MKSLLLTLTILILTTATAAQESTHNTNLKFVSDTYWTYLNRAPDKQGMIFWVHEIDYGAKDKEALIYATKVSIEYREMSQHVEVCNQDYTKARNFLQVLNLPHQELVVVRGQYNGRGLIGNIDGNDQDLGILTGFLGNTISLKDGTCTYSFWFNYAALGVEEGSRMTSKLPNSKSLTVTYDPVTGLATKVEMEF